MTSAQVLAAVVGVVFIALGVYAKLARRFDQLELALFKLTNLASQAVAGEALEDAVESGSPYRDSPKVDAPPKSYAKDSLAGACPICGSCDTGYVPCHGKTDGEQDEGWCVMRGQGHAHQKCSSCGAKHIYVAKRTKS